MTQLYLEKYPVTSRNGNVYAVTVWQHAWGMIYTDVYQKERGLFGRTKFKRLTGGVSDKRYDLDEWDYDFVEMAKRAVSDYEKESLEKQLHNERIAESSAKFNEWDGDCR